MQALVLVLYSDYKLVEKVHYFDTKIFNLSLALGTIPILRNKTEGGGDLADDDEGCYIREV